MRWCIYHSPEWQVLVETGWITASVEDHVAVMLPKPERRW